MDIASTLARGLAINRIAFGLGYIAAPERTGKGWVGKAAEKGGATVLTRALGARDLVLGAGALWAMQRRAESARPWFAAHAVADATDLAATVAARDSLPRSGFRFALALAGISTAIAVLGATSAD
ncbi:MAG TPA: hypothetical protein VKA88_03865 [Solirubrobacterales bacterium]|nr:hypothetical protein [Solirubrobacterales bacterium]